MTNFSSSPTGQLKAIPHSRLSDDERLLEAEVLLTSHISCGDGRAPWCSWYQRSLDEDLLYFSRIDTNLRSTEAFRSAVEATASLFERTSNTLGTRGKPSLLALNTLIVLDLEQSLVEETLQEQREHLLEAGQMIGLLTPASELQSLQGRVGYPYRCRRAFLTTRRPVASDLVFVAPNPRLRAILEAYLGSTTADAI